MGPLVEQRGGDLDGFRHHFRNFDELLLEFDLSSCDPGHVEEVVHQARQVADLALDDRALPLQSTAATELHQLQGRQDRRQRIPQLVAQHGQELVLGPIGGLRRLPQPVELVPRHHLLGHIRRDDKDALDLALRVSEWGIDEVESTKSASLRLAG